MDQTMKRRLIAVVSILAVIGLGFFIYYQYFTFRVTNTTPEVSKIMTATPFVTFTFNKPIESFDSAIGYSSSDAQLVMKSEVKDSGIVLTLSNLEPEQQLTIILKNIKSKDGYTIAEHRISVTPIPTDTEQMTTEERDEVLRRQDEFHSIDYDPIVDVLPYNTPSYTMSPVLVSPSGAEKVVYKIVLTINLSAGEVRSGADTYAAEYQEEALQYLREQGINLEDYEVETTTASSSLY